MANIDAKLVKDLRTKTGAGFMDCKKALSETDGNIEQAIDYLRKKGIAKAAKKSEREASEGYIGNYIHMNGKIGVIVELNCETDFVARNEEFRTLAKDIAMHIAASKPQYVKPEDIPADVIERERSIYSEQMKESGKPENIIEKIVDGKINKFYEETCLLEQPFVKEPEKKVKDLIFEKVGKMGENIQVGSFNRIEIGK
jgi:elongation factor Ts